jgi:hypothetical protein
MHIVANKLKRVIPSSRGIKGLSRRNDTGSEVFRLYQQKLSKTGNKIQNDSPEFSIANATIGIFVSPGFRACQKF